jgi:hypothetical protein
MNDIHPDCAACRARLEGWTGDSASDTDRRALADHITGCEACRQRAVAADPSILFVALRGGALPDRFWAGFDDGLKRRIAAEAARPAPARLAARLAALAAGVRDAVVWLPSPAIWAAPAAMILVLGVTVAILRPDAFRPPMRPPQAGALPSPYAPPGGSPRPAGPRRETAIGAALPALLPGAGDPPALEEVSSPSARVYRFDAADAPGAPIYFVVDEAIEF